MIRLNPYLTFPGTCEQAMRFYEEVLGGELAISYFKDFPAAGGPSPEGVMHAMLETSGGMVIMASDAPLGDAGAPSGMSLSLSGDDEGTLRGYWEQLSGSGSVTMPLEEQMWGDMFGMCRDRFGIAWMVNISKVAVSA